MFLVLLALSSWSRFYLVAQAISLIVELTIGGVVLTGDESIIAFLR